VSDADWNVIDNIVAALDLSFEPIVKVVAEALICVDSSACLYATMKLCIDELISK
jgi:hypothetical protein